MCNCNKSNTNRRDVVIPAQNSQDIDMRDYVLSLGWVESGSCGCGEKMAYYLNPTYPNWMIEINERRQVFRISLKINNSEYKRKGQAGPLNYMDAYQYWIINIGNNLV